MAYLVYFLAGLFLPLFPLSMPFNFLYARVRNPLLRALLLLLWPQLGLLILSSAGLVAPGWIIMWALLTALLYALRALSLRELGLWTSFVGTSAWALLWLLVVSSGAGLQQLQLYGLGMSVPLVLMALLSGGLERRYGAAYLGLYGGLAQSMPRYTGVLVVVVLAIVATPLFPGFFTMLSLLFKTISLAPLAAVGVASVWLLWSWAGAKLLQSLIAGTARESVADLSPLSTWLYILVLLGLVVAGINWLGGVA